MADKSILHKGMILTADKIIARRADRLRYHEQFRAGVVQMEHGWFLLKLKKLVTPVVFEGLYFTHIETILDEVPDLHASPYKMGRELLLINTIYKLIIVKPIFLAHINQHMIDSLW